MKLCLSLSLAAAKTAAKRSSALLMLHLLPINQIRFCWLLLLEQPEPQINFENNSKKTSSGPSFAEFLHSRPVTLSLLTVFILLGVLLLGEAAAAGRVLGVFRRQRRLHVNRVDRGRIPGGHLETAGSPPPSLLCPCWLSWSGVSEL